MEKSQARIDGLGPLPDNLSAEDLGQHHIAFGVSQILRGLHEAYGLDVEDPNFVGTPARVARAYKEIFGGLRGTEEQVQDLLSTAFPCSSSEMVIQTDIRVFSMCPHHLLPVDYNMAIAYIPKKGARVLGLSKLSRLAEILARRPVLQEQLVADITDSLLSMEGCAGAACYAEGMHFCMAMRGAHQPNARTITSSMRGVFYDDDGARQEFLSLAK